MRKVLRRRVGLVLSLLGCYGLTSGKSSNSGFVLLVKRKRNLVIYSIAIHLPNNGVKGYEVGGPFFNVVIALSSLTRSVCYCTLRLQLPEEF